MRRLAVVWVLWLIAVASAAPATAQQRDPSDMFGRPVVAVTLTLEGQPLQDERLAGLIEVRVGEPLEPGTVRETLAHLFNLGRFEDVVVTAVQREAGVEVIFALTPVHPVDRLEFRGTPGVDTRTLEQAVLEVASGRLSTVRPEAAREAVERLLVEEGFARPSVRVTVEATHAVHRASMIIEVESGPRLRIGTVTVVGDGIVSRAEVTSAIGVETGAPYRRRAIEDALRRVAERLRARRYYEAVITHQAEPADGGTVNVTVSVAAGPIVDIVVEGDPLPPGGGLDEWIPIRRENSADDDLLEDAAFRIRQAWQREGYWRAEVTPRKTLTDGDRRMQVTFTITRGLRYRIGAISATGQQHFDERDIRALVGLHEGDPFVESVLDARLGALTAAYAIAGFDAEVEYLAQSSPGEPGVVDVRLTIDEGPLRLVNRVDIAGAGQVPEAALRRVIRSQSGQPLRAAQVRDDRNAVQQVYLDRGFQNASVEVRVSDQAPFVVSFVIVEGIQTVVDHIIVVGNRRVATETILDEVSLRPGQPYGQGARIESQRRLAELATFRRIQISQAAEGRQAGHVDVVIQVEEAPATTIGYGGGLEFGRRVRSAEGGGTEDALWFAPRGFFEVGRRNLFGGNRTVSLFSRASLGSRNEPQDPQQDGRGLELSEYRVTGTYRSPRAFGGLLDATLSATAERAIRTSFTFVRRAVHAEVVRRTSPRASVFGRYALDSTELYDARIPADEQPLIDRLFPQIRLSSLSSGVVWDRRDDVLDPTAGSLLSLDGELAVRSLGSEVGFVKAFAQAYGFRRITRRNRVILAGRVQVGLARGFAREVVVLDVAGTPARDETGQTRTEVVKDLPAGRRFFAGGSTTVRGFQQDRLGVPAVLNDDGLSSGGNGVIVLNGEVRTQITGAFGLVGFIDGGNVFARASDLSLGELRGAVGLGVRYRSPLGPLRLDFGFKLDRRLIAGVRERGWEFHLSIGEVF
jgi:outer membrane protein insertion porin family